MGLFEKIKNIFYDEEIVDVPEEPKSVEKPKIEEVKVEKKVEPIKRETPVINTTPTYSEREIFTRETTNTFKFPMLDEEEVKPARTRVNALESARMEKKKEETEKARTDKYKGVRYIGSSAVGSKNQYGYDIPLTNLLEFSSKGKPFIRRTFEENKDKLIEIIKGEIENGNSK